MAAMLEEGLVGTTLDGRYRIVRLLGMGGMGAVYAADHVGLHQQVAIKVMLSGADADARARFQREARAAARVVNEHIVRVFDVSTDASRSYIAMEYVEGTDLDQVLGSGPLDAERALRIIKQVLVGVGAIHAAGLVHRDIKPANILITSRDDGSDLVKIMDFGVAKTVEIGDDTLTGAGHAVGTIAYMAPEQLVGGNVDHRADLYAVGLTLYRMLTGELPTTAFTRIAEAKRGERAATPALRVARVPPVVAAALECVLDPEPVRRFGSAGDFIAALDGAPITSRDNAATSVGRASTSAIRRDAAGSERRGSTSSTDATPAPRRWRLVLAAIAVLGVVATSVVVATRPAPAPAAAPPVASNATPVDAAIDHIARGRDAELAGKLQLAIVEYEEAFARNGSADLLYRLGELSDRLGRPAEAATYYERYLVARPDASDRSVVLARIRAVREPVATDAGVAATIPVGVTKDAGRTTPARDAGVTPPPTAAAPSHPPYRGQPGSRCECIGQPPAQLCSAVVPVPECTCQIDSQKLCKYPMHTVDGSTDCVDTTREECLGKNYPDNCNAWIESVGVPDNGPCQGYRLESSTPVDGAWTCTVCETVYFAAEGRARDLNGTACQGFHRTSGVLTPGTFRYCR